MILQSKIGGDYKPHPEGIHPALCVDVIDLGMVESEYQGERRMVNKVRLVFESEQRTDEGKNCIVTKTFTASLNTKAKLAEFLGKWRGRPVVPGETIDLGKLVGANCTLVISHQQNLVGRTYASIDAVSKPTKRLAASGHYDPVAARQRIEERRQAGGARSQSSLSGATRTGHNTERCRTDTSAQGQSVVRSGVSPHFLSPTTPQKGAGLTPLTQAQPVAAAQHDYDPDVGF